MVGGLKYKLFLFIFLVVLTQLEAKVWGAELYEFYRGVRAMAMGNAFTAISDDYDAVFYNPAGIAYNKRIELILSNTKVDVSSDAVKSVSLMRSSSDFNASTFNKFMGKHLRAEMSMFPSIHLPHLSFGYYLGGRMSLVGRNLAYPQLETVYSFDKGVVAGTGFEFKGFSKKHFLRVGASVKWLQRIGYDGTIPLSSLVTANTSYLKSLRKGPESGFSTSLGFQYEIGISKLDEVILASAWQDIGGLQFGSRLTSSVRPPMIPGVLSAGGAYIHHFTQGKRMDSYNLKLSAEMRHLNIKYLDPFLRLHAGAELEFGSLGIQFGYNQDSLCAGAYYELWGFIKAIASTYGSETQSQVFMDRDRRYMVQVQVKFDLGGQEFKTQHEEDRRRKPRTY